MTATALTPALARIPQRADTHVAPSSAPVQATTQQGTTQLASPREGPTPFARLLRGLGSEIELGEGTVRNALVAPTASRDPAELIALQAGVYRYSEAVDLTARLVEHATTGVKTVLQGQ